MVPFPHRVLSFPVWGYSERNRWWTREENYPRSDTHETKAKDTCQSRRTSTHHQSRDPYPPGRGQSGETCRPSCSGSRVSSTLSAVCDALLYRRVAKQAARSSLSDCFVQTLASRRHHASGWYRAIVAQQSRPGISRLSV